MLLPVLHYMQSLGLNRITYEECDALKDESISSHRAWVTAGKPHDGAIAIAMRKAKYAYKHALKRKRCQEHNTFTNELMKPYLRRISAHFGKLRMLSLVVGLVPKLLMGLVIMGVLQKLSVIHTLLSSHLTTNRTITSCSRNFKHIMLITLVTMVTLIVCSLSNWLTGSVMS